MSSSGIIVSCVVCCGIAAFAIFFLKRRGAGKGRSDCNADARLGRLSDSQVDGEVLSENAHVFSGFIKHHEKRILAFLIEKEAERRSLGRERILSLRGKYGTELVRPAYDAQDQLGKCGINPMEVTRLQKAWIIRNGGNANAHPTTREVERILIERNREKAVAICSDVP